MKYEQLSIFDLDHTLLRGNCSFHFGLFLFRNGLLPRANLLLATAYYGAHRYFSLTSDRLHHNIFRLCFRGVSISKLRQFVEDFLDQHFSILLYVPMLRLLQDALRQNHYTLLVSTSPNFLVEAIAKRLNLHQCFATHYSVDIGGRLDRIQTVMDGKAKAECAKKYINDLNINMHNVVAYTDSYLDLPLLKNVGRPVAVNPDKILKSICQQNCWEIIQK